MLDAHSKEIVKATAPVLKEHSHEIGRHFYKLLFTRVPALYNLFNQTNQKTGQQQDALAYAVYAAGEHIDNLDAIKPLVRRVAEKHRALGVQAEQYPIVGETLLQAVKEVLGDTATDDILKAWGNAYNYIADIFISIEQDLYAETKEKTGGWIDYRDFRVDKKVKESDIITSFYLKPADGQPIAAYEAGQYLTIRADIEGETYSHVRHYSLSDISGKDYYRISVKREEGNGNAPEGIVSNYLHNVVEEGDVLPVAAPAGDFRIENEELPLVLISGGIGLTPMVSMLKEAVEEKPHRPVAFIHGTVNSETHALREEVEQLAADHEGVTAFFCYEAPTDKDRKKENYDKEGFIELPWLKSVLPNNQADFYFCGSVPFTKVINEILKEWGVPAEHSHFEVFNPVSILEEA